MRTPPGGEHREQEKHIKRVVGPSMLDERSWLLNTKPNKDPNGSEKTTTARKRELITQNKL